MDTRSQTYIDQQKRDALAQKNALAVESAVQSLPPAFIAGFRIVYQADHNVRIEPGLANVGGYRVELKANYILRQADEQVERLTAAWRYIYIDRQAKFYVDNIKPVINTTYGDYYHPRSPWRFLGRMFIDDDHYTKYAGKGIYVGPQATVAAADYTGEASYYCTGENDELIINAAIQYVSSVYGGGTVRLLEGAFNQSSNYVLLSYVTLEGSGVGTVSTTTGSPANSLLATSVTGCRLSNIRFVDPSRFFFDTVTDLGISGCIFYGAYKGAASYGVIHILDGNSVLIDNNTIDGNLQDAGWSTGGFAFSTTPNLICRGNIIKNVKSAVAYSAIYSAAGHIIISNNQINNIESTVGGSTIWGILAYGDYGIISGNTIQGVKNTGTAANAFGIVVQNGSISMKVDSNYCYNNGADTGIANTNGNTFSDAGTDTQVHSNSWQSPFAGEPSLGTGHFHSVLILNASAASDGTWRSINIVPTYAPVGTRAVFLLETLLSAVTPGDSGTISNANGGTIYITQLTQVANRAIAIAGFCPIDVNGNIWWRGASALLTSFSIWLHIYDI